MVLSGIKYSIFKFNVFSRRATPTPTPHPLASPRPSMSYIPNYPQNFVYPPRRCKGCTIHFAYASGILISC